MLRGGSCHFLRDIQTEHGQQAGHVAYLGMWCDPRCRRLYQPVHPDDIDAGCKAAGQIGASLVADVGKFRRQYARLAAGFLE